MIAQLNDISQIWWQWMGSMFWQASLLIILVTALDMVIRKWAWPQVRYALWALVFIKLIITPAWQMPTSIVSWVQPQVQEQITLQVAMSETEESSVNYNPPGETIAPVIVEHTSWESFALLTWFSGVVIFTLMLLRKMYKFRKMNNVENETVIPEWFNELMSKTAARLKLSKIPCVIFSKDAKSPAVYGVFRPVLLLPDGYLDKLSEEQAEHVLIHELCHLKRGDLFVHWFCIVIQIVYWFNPLLIWTRRQMRHVCEICCDLSVAYILREKTVSYRETLLHSARELFAENMQPSLGFFGIFEEPFRLVSRLKWLEKKSWEKRKLKVAVTICTTLFMVACVMPMSKPSHEIKTEQPEDQNADRRTAKKADKELLDLDFNNTDITHLLRFINEVSGKNIIWDPAIKGRTISVTLKDVLWDEALDLILKETRLARRNVGENVIWVTTEERMKQVIAVEKAEKLRESSDIIAPKKEYKGELLDLDVIYMDVTVLLRLINKVSGVNIIWDSAIEGRKISMVLKDVPWYEALDLVLKGTGLVKRNVSDNVIWITTSEKMKQILSEEEAAIKPFTVIREEPDKKKRPRTYLETIDLSQLNISTIITGTMDSWAIVKDNRGMGHVIKEGTAIGTNGGIVFKIKKGEVIIREEYTDSRGNTQHRDITKKIQTPDIRVSKMADKALLNLKFDDTDVTKILAMISEDSGVNIIWDPVIKDRKVSMVLKDVSRDEALELVLKNNELEKRNVGKNVIMITTKDKMSQILAEEEAERRRLEQKLEQERLKLANIKSRDTKSNISTDVESHIHKQLAEINLEIARLKTEINETKVRIKYYEIKVEETPKREQELVALNKDFQSIETKYNSLRNKKIDADLAISMERKQDKEKSDEMEKKQGTSAFLSDELKTAEKRLKEKKEEIKAYREKYMGGLPEQLQTNLTILEKLQKEDESLSNGLRDLEMRRDALLMALAASKTPKDTDDIVTHLKEQLQLLESKYTSNHPDIIRLKEVIAGLETAE